MQVCAQCLVENTHLILNKKKHLHQLYIQANFKYEHKHVNRISVTIRYSIFVRVYYSLPHYNWFESAFWRTDKMSKGDISKYRNRNETDKEWQLKSMFIEHHFDKFDEARLLCLAQCYVNVETLGCRWEFVRRTIWTRAYFFAMLDINLSILNACTVTLMR